MRNSPLVVALITALLAFGASAQSVPDAPQPQKAPAKPPSPPAKQPPAKDDNPFPEDVSRDAAKAAPKPTSTDDNPFPEDVSRDAAKAAGNDQAPPPAPAAKSDLPPGVSSSQSSSQADDPATMTQEADPARATKDAEIGGFYLKTGNYQGALLRYKDATAADPTNVAAIFGLAETQRALGKTAEAATSYQLYLDIVPNGPKAKEALKALKALQRGK
jgi:tetratricopeptide (TPR) repeat protein